MKKLLKKVVNKLKEVSNSGKGFTLLELLVVILIIGILAAIALPQYRKAIERSKASEALLVLNSLQKSFEAYYLVNGTYPTKFSDVDVSLPNMTGHVAQLISYNNNVKDTISNNDWSLQIQAENAGTPYYLILMTRISGKYKGGGFMLRFIPSYPISCYERYSNLANFVISKPGIYCEKIMNANFMGGTGFGNHYSL